MNKIYMAFDEIHASNKIKEETIKICARKRKSNIMPAIAACVLALCFISGGGVFYASATEAAYISMDMNESIGLSLNRFKRVISADAYDSGAAEIIAGLELKGKKYYDAVGDIIECERLREYDISEAEIYIESNSEELGGEIDSVIGELCPQANLSCHNAENKEKAAEYNISPGKYYLIEKIIRYSGTIDDYKDMSMRELKEIYSGYADEYELEETPGNGKRHNNGGGGSNGKGKRKHGG